eukprot:gene24241-29438_t
MNLAKFLVLVLFLAPVACEDARTQSTKSCIVVVSHFGPCANLNEISKITSRSGCGMHVIDKTEGFYGFMHTLLASCSSDKWQYVRRANVGRDAGSALDYVIENYDSLPDILIFTSSSIQKHDRRARLSRLLNINGSSCANNGQHPRTSVYLNQEKNFRIHDYGHSRVTPSTDGAFGEWYDKYVGNLQKDAEKRSCFNIIFRTTRANLRRKPPSFYKALARQVNASPDNEYGHFIERSVASIFINDEQY